MLNIEMLNSIYVFYLFLYYINKNCIKKHVLLISHGITIKKKKR